LHPQPISQVTLLISIEAYQLLLIIKIQFKKMAMKNRRQNAYETRQSANKLARDREHPRHISNSDEQKFRHKKGSEISKCHKKEHDDSHDSEDIKLEGKPSYLMSFTKGMPHNKDTGLINNPIHFQYFVRGIDSGDPRDFRDTPLGPEGHIGDAKKCKAPDAKIWKSHKAKTGNADKGSVGLRAWESQSAGLAFELEGPDAQAVTMPPAPSLGSDELTGEIGEVYAQALLRDTPFNGLTAGVIEKQYIEKKHEKIPKNAVVNKAELTKLCAEKGAVEDFLKYTEHLKELKWFSGKDLKLDSLEQIRRCDRICPTPSSAFRGITEGDDIGPYLSQFLLMGNAGINGNDMERDVAEGLISYGAISIDQRVRTATPEKDYMTTWEEWLDVQHAASVGGLESYVPKSDPNSRRFIYTPRDLATYVHYDALYEAYLNACLILLGTGSPFDPGIPFQEDDTRDHQQGFAHFGGPHILSLVTEVATRALKAVRFQKYNVHRRCRPEVLAARITKADILKDMAPELKDMKHELKNILKHVDMHNNAQNKKDPDKIITHPLSENYLLPMAFCEGSPMHPAYGAGHATVAGACVTILKAFFDCKRTFKPNGKDSDMAFVSVNHGKTLKEVPVFNQNCEKSHLTVEGELNKLASNISIGRNWGGVHYFTDYYESLLMGEQIAIGILEEQKLLFKENFSMTLPLFNGNTIRI